MAGQFGNTNHLKHGLVSGALPPGSGYIAKITTSLRNMIEDAVKDLRGEITLVDAANIQTAIRWERHALLAQRWLRKEAATLTADQRLAFSRETARASAERDKCLRALRLEKNTTADLITTLYSQPELPEPSDSPETSD